MVSAPTLALARLAGIHHLKLPVSDLAWSLEWYRSRLGYQVQVEFVEQGTLMGYGLAREGPRPCQSRPAARPGPGPRRRRIRLLRHRRGRQGRYRPARPQARRASARADALAGRASIGWKIPPRYSTRTGTRLRFYTMQHHTDVAPPVRSPRSTIRGKPPSDASARKPLPRVLRLRRSETGGGTAGPEQGTG